MTKTISLTVPMDYNALTRASDMLHGMAVDLKHDTPEAPTLHPETVERAPEAPTLHPETVEEAPEAPTLHPETVERAPEAPTLHPETVVTGAVEGAPDAAEVFGDQQPAAPAETATVGVDLAPSTTNADVPVPWDARIHAGSKSKLAKAPHGWKMKRGVGDDLVARVEAELIAAMQASPAKPVEAAPEPTAALVEPVGSITTFPALMSAITANGIAPAKVTEAVNAQGLQSLPLLAARPDLIPAVAAELFPGG